MKIESARKAVALYISIIALAGCASLPECPRPAMLNDALSGREYVGRALAWQAYGMCLDGSEVEELAPVVEPVETPWERGERLERERLRQRASGPLYDV